MRLTATLLVLFLPLLTLAQTQPVNREKYQLFMEAIETEIVIDGVLDEAPWQQAEVAGQFHRILPTDEGYAESQTEVRMCYDADKFYIGIICYDTLPGKRPAESLRRDFSFGKNDNFIAFIDTYNDQTNGFAFGISAAGAQWEGIQANGGFVSLNWDTKWRSAVTNHPDRWVAEFEIPFRSIRYRDGATEWGINFSRLDLKSAEKSSWAPVPRQFQSANLAFTGTLHWNQPLPKKGIRYSLIPYVFGQVSKDIENQQETVWTPKVGLDAKVTLSTSLNLDLTVNPDFSQVDVDRQVVNLERFELFFPERRQFFLENSDLFASLGSEANRPFFSRRIGLNSPVVAGARLSGKLGERGRIGLMNMQTGTQDEELGSNFSVLVLQQQIFARSNLNFFMVNKQVSDPQVDPEKRFSRVAGLDLNLASADARWTGKIFHHQAFYPGAKADAFTSAVNLTYETQFLKASVNNSWIGEDYRSEMGFIRRTGVFQFNPSFSYKFFPESKTIANHGPGVELNLFADRQLDLADRTTTLTYQVSWLNRSTLSVGVSENFIRLLAPFDPTNTGGEELPTGSKHRWQEVGASYFSAPQGLFTYSLTGKYGGFFNGTLLSVGGELNYRFQPYGSIGLISSFNQVDLPLPYSSANILLVGPKLDLTFTNTLFFTGFLQYNNQVDNVNLNLRFQWRYAPGSDLFIVYTGNSFPADFSSKNRGLAVKLSYWFN